MEINHILVVSPMHSEIQMLIEKEEIHKDFRYLPEEKLTVKELAWADALVCFNLKSNIDYSQVKWVHSLGAGVDRFLLGKDWDEEVLLTRTICSFGQRIAEYCLSYILSDLQYHTVFEELNRQKKWMQITPRLLSGKKIMIYGTGEIGQTVAKIFSTLGLEVHGVSLSGKEKEHFNEVMTVPNHFSKLRNVDYIINTLPLTEQTAHFFDKKIFEQLSKVGFISVGRGASLNETDLLDAIKNQHVRFAVLDVFSQEPLPTDHPFWNHPNIHITPHISAVTTPDEGVACFIETFKKIEMNQPLINKVDIKKGY
jgi:glyoxylate/hydroxypyruvate reductase